MPNPVNKLLSSSNGRSARMPSTRVALALMLFMFVSFFAFRLRQFEYKKSVQIKVSDVNFLDNLLDQPVAPPQQVEASSRLSQSRNGDSRAFSFQEEPFEKATRQISQDKLHRPSQEVILDKYAAAARRNEQLLFVRTCLLRCSSRSLSGYNEPSQAWLDSTS